MKNLSFSFLAFVGSITMVVAQQSNATTSLDSVQRLDEVIIRANTI